MSTKWFPILILLLLLSGLYARHACRPAEADRDDPRLVCHLRRVIAAFEQENNVKVQFLKAGDTGTALNKAILSKGNPLADVFYGVDNTFLSRALDEGIFEPYASPALADIPAEFQLDPEQPGPAGGLRRRVPELRQGLLRRKGHLPRPHPWKTCSSPSTRACWWCRTRPPPRPGWLSCWRPSPTSARMATWITGRGWSPTMCMVVNDWETAYYTEFSGSSGRDRARSWSPTAPARLSK